MANQVMAEDVIFEHQFWLQILGDHGRFIHDSMSPDETEKLAQADFFIRIFDRLLEQARNPSNAEHFSELNETALTNAEAFRKFKLELIRDHIAGTIKIGLPPTFINHMVNEIEEYIRIMLDIQQGRSPTAVPLHYHSLWLPDAAGHAGAVHCRLDDVEEDLRKKSEQFMEEFHGLHRKAEEFVGYTRTNLQEFPAMTRLNQQAETSIGLFMEFLQELEQQLMNKTVLGTLMPLMTDHMFREECYYLHSLAKATEVRNPKCNPSKPRIQD